MPCLVAQKSTERKTKQNKPNPKPICPIIFFAPPRTRPVLRFHCFLSNQSDPTAVSKPKNIKTIREPDTMQFEPKETKINQINKISKH